MKKSHRWRRAAVRGAVICGLVAAFFEIVLRFFGYGSSIIYQPDQELLWLPAPGQRGTTVVGHEPISINREGFRYGVDLGRSDPEEVRIFAFGDSVTMGWGVDDDSHYSAVLERLLSERTVRQRVRVISAGVNAYPLTLCVRRFEKLLRDGFQIDGAILAYSFNPSHEPLSRLEGEEKQAFLRKVSLKSLVRRSAIYNLVIEDFLREAVYYRLRERLVAGSWEVDTSQPPEIDLEHYLAPLETMNALSARHGIKLVFLVLSSKGQVAGLREYQQAFLDFARRREIPVVNMFSELEAMDHEPLFMDHVHPSAAGHELIAAKLLPVVEPWVLERARDQ